MSKNNLSDLSLLTFKNITEFITNLSEIHEDVAELSLYNLLLQQTTLSHSTAIEKHIDCFKSFMDNNKASIHGKDYTSFDPESITYSEKVFVNVKKLFEASKDDEETLDTLWQYIFTLNALLNPSDEAKHILKQHKIENEGTAQEVDFLTDAISKLEGAIDPNANPLESMGQLLQSGVFTDLIKTMGDGLQNGTLDIGQMLGSVQKLAGDKAGTGGMDMNTMLSMMNNLNGPNNPTGD